MFLAVTVSTCSLKMSTSGDAESEKLEVKNAPAEESKDSNTVSAKSRLLTRLRAGDMSSRTLFSMQTVFRWNQRSQKSLRSKRRAKQTEQPGGPDHLNNKVSPATLKKHSLKTTLKSYALITSSPPAFSGIESSGGCQAEETPPDMPAKVVAFFFFSKMQKLSVFMLEKSNLPPFG